MSRQMFDLLDMSCNIEICHLHVVLNAYSFVQWLENL
jgi:hypothetical protein